MNQSSLSRLYHDCRKLQSEGRHEDALKLLEASYCTRADHDPLYWVWKGAVLLSADRVKEAEDVLRAHLKRPDWPDGHPGIAYWLAAILERTDRLEAAAHVAAPWAARGDIDCAMVRFRAMFRMGKAEEVLTPLQRLAASARSHVGVQLVFLEVVNHLGSAGQFQSHREVSARCIQLLKNLKRAGVQFSPDESNKFESLIPRDNGGFRIAK